MQDRIKQKSMIIKWVFKKTLAFASVFRQKRSGMFHSGPLLNFGTLFTEVKTMHNLFLGRPTSILRTK